LQDTDIALYHELSEQSDHADEAAAELVAHLVTDATLTPDEGKKLLRELRQANYEYWRYVYKTHIQAH
jgi:polyhydroxyalkanoate synthesis regulator phasin